MKKIITGIVTKKGVTAVIEKKEGGVKEFVKTALPKEHKSFVAFVSMEKIVAVKGYPIVNSDVILRESDFTIGAHL